MSRSLSLAFLCEDSIETLSRSSTEKNKYLCDAFGEVRVSPFRRQSRVDSPEKFSEDGILGIVYDKPKKWLLR